MKKTQSMMDLTTTGCKALTLPEFFGILERGQRIASLAMLALNCALPVATVCASEGAASPAPAAPLNSRAPLLAAANLPELVCIPAPHQAIALPEDWCQTNLSVMIRLSQPPPGSLSVRRVSRNDGRLYLEVRAAPGAISGTAEVQWGGRRLGLEQLDGSLWLSLKPRIGRIQLSVFSPGAQNPVQLVAATSLVEIRGRRLFLNAEPFLMKGAMARDVNQADAAYLHSMGLNTLRGLEALEACERYGFMNLASLNAGKAVSKKSVTLPEAQFQPAIGKYADWLKESAPARVASPYTLILQLGNEFTGGGVPPGAQSMSNARRQAAQMLAAGRNCVKALDPMLPVGYANQDLTFLAPDCMDVYMHNSFLDRDRYDYPWHDFLRWQGCLPRDGPTREGRPFVNSEFGANRYLCQSYLEGPNNPFLEKLHAWNFPCRWLEFMENGTVGGCIYCLYDLESPRDQGCSRFGILTFDRQPKLACWEIARLWRDFDVTVSDGRLVIAYKRDYWARDCRLTVTSLTGQRLARQLEDFAPHSRQTILMSELSAAQNASGFRWAFDFKTHAGLTNAAAGAWPPQVEEQDFLERLKTRDTFPFLKELFDAEVLTVDGKPAPRTLADMSNREGIIAVALRKRNGVAYVLLISREDPNARGALRDGLTIDVAFRGNVVKVDDMTGQPLEETVAAEPLGDGLRLKNIRAARIPGAIGQRSKTPFMLPIYRISP